MVEAIRALRVRGAPAIGICAAYCLYVLARSIDTPDPAAFSFVAKLVPVAALSRKPMRKPISF